MVPVEYTNGYPTIDNTFSMYDAMANEGNQAGAPQGAGAGSYQPLGAPDVVYPPAVPTVPAEVFLSPTTPTPTQAIENAVAMDAAPVMYPFRAWGWLLVGISGYMLLKERKKSKTPVLPVIGLGVGLYLAFKKNQVSQSGESAGPPATSTDAGTA